MRTLILLFLTLTVLQVSHAQRRDRSISLGFKTWPGTVKPMPGGRWLVVATGEAVPGKSFTDSVFALIFNTEGDVLLRKRLELPIAETNNVRDALVNPDGSFVIVVKQGLCDAGLGLTVIQKFDPAGELLWSKFGETWDHLPTILERGADGSIWGTDGEVFWYKLDPSTGETIWKKTFDSFGSNSVWVSDFVLIPGSEDIVAVGNPEIQRWEPDPWEPNESYRLVRQQTIAGDVSTWELAQTLSGVAYTFDAFRGHEVYRFSTETLKVTPLKKYPFEIQDMALAPNGLVLLAVSNNRPLIVRTDWNGQVQDSVQFFGNQWLTSRQVATNANNIAVLGWAGSGPSSQAALWEKYVSDGLWLHTMGGAVPPPNNADAAVKKVHQLSAMDTSSVEYEFSPTGRAYTIKGGNFQVQISNEGSETLNEVDVMTGFNWSEIPICYFRSAHRRHYSNLNLAPGASMLLEFGDLLGEKQHDVPTEFCFWTASPNEKPDIDPDNDVFCLTPTVNAFIPSDELIAILPNPVSDELLVINSTQFSDYQVYDLWGKAVVQGSFLEGQSRTLISVQHLPPGHYWLRIGTWTGKVVVAPR